MRRHGLLEPKSLKVFDQGFGLGLMLFCFPPDTSIAGLELAESAVQSATDEARKRGYSNIDLRTFQPGRAYPQEWREKFDLIISSHVLEHCENPQVVLAELLELLKPGGVACLIVPINEAPGEDLNHFYWFTPKSLTDMATAVGLIPLESLECDRLWALGTPIALARQRQDSVPKHIASLIFNCCTAILPNPVLEAVDRALAGTRYRNRQFFLLARKPSGGADETA